jgi:integral membrane protein
MSETQQKQLTGALKFFKVTSYITGVVLLMVMVLWGLRRLGGLELWAFGPNGLLTLEAYGAEGLGLPTTGASLTVLILIVHGWLYVAYLFGDFRLWTMLRWGIGKFLIIALGGIVPFLSFFTERYFAKVAEGYLKKTEAN